MIDESAMLSFTQGLTHDEARLWIKDATYQQLDAERDLLERDLANIKAQIDRATGERYANNVWSDPLWYRSALSARRYKGAIHQMVLRELKSKKREHDTGMKTAKDKWRIAFVDLCRHRLDPVVYQQIKIDADKIVAGHPHQPPT